MALPKFMIPDPTKSKSSNTPEKMECEKAIPNPGAESDIVKEKINIKPASTQNDTPKVLKADWENCMNKMKGGTSSPDIKVRYPTEETLNINGSLSKGLKRSKADACGEGNENESGSATPDKENKNKVRKVVLARSPRDSPGRVKGFKKLSVDEITDEILDQIPLRSGLKKKPGLVVMHLSLIKMPCRWETCLMISS